MGAVQSGASVVYKGVEHGSARTTEIFIGRPLGIVKPKRMELFYWKVKARGYAICALARYSLLYYKVAGPQIDLREVHEFDMATLRDSLPFGQLPFLKHADIELAQSNAILRYLAKEAELEGSTPQQYAMSEMLIEESTDIFNLLVKANSAATSNDKIKAYVDLFDTSPDAPISKQLRFLEKILSTRANPNSFFFQTPKRIAGEFALAAVLDILVSLEPTVLQKTPSVEAFYKHMMAMECFNVIRDYPMYFKRM